MAKIKVRARAVDMLGRQQIAGIPTAIHELFKNAHDAYASKVRVDYIEALDLFLLRDNGLGMTRADFEGKWLTLGTESKLGQNEARVSVWTGPDNQPRRALLGEKGIGRLAIAAIGPQMLVLTRASREEGLHPPVCAFINWSLFEQPGIDLDDVDVPIIELQDWQAPTKAEIAKLVSDAVRNIDVLRAKIGENAYARIKAEVDQFTFDPSVIYQALGGISFGDRNYGTHFFIRPTNQELGFDLRQTRQEGEISGLQRFLLGFGNTMRGEKQAPPIIAEFWHHRPDGTAEDLIGPYSFFTPEEFLAADHHVSGDFDEFGVFTGKVRIYDKLEFDYTVAPPDEIKGRTECGPFSFDFAYVQGNAKDTRMALDEWKRVGDKLNSIGGLYIYRDGIRILPYGNSDYDWLNIEKRRTYAAKDWFFSYRRLFGGVILTHQQNADLVEKAGREGFLQNKAYRQLALLAERLFQRLAYDFFRENARISTDYHEMKKIRQREYEILQKRAKSVKASKVDFSKALGSFFEKAREGAFEKECDRIRGDLILSLTTLDAETDPVAAGERLLQIEKNFDSAVLYLQGQINITRPRSFGLTKKQNQDWEAYSGQKKQLIDEVLQPLINDISEKIRDCLKSGKAQIEPRKRLEEPVQQETSTALTATGKVRGETDKAFKDLGQKVHRALKQGWLDLNEQVEKVKADLARTEVAALSPDEIERRRDYLVSQVRDGADRFTHQMQSLREQLSSVTDGLSGDPSLVDVTAALESENDTLKEQVDQYTELAQVGMALGLVQHEFSAQVRSINRGLDALKPWADQNQGLDRLYGPLRTSFEHLESYLQLFVPLNRRLQRRRVPVSGMEIEEFLETIFGQRFERHKIKLTATDVFRRTTVLTFPSTLLPVYTNIVDNAVFWLSHSSIEKKTITLDVRYGSLILANNGPGIDAENAERMFEFGATTKPGGRGMGLYLSRDALKKENMVIHLERAGSNVPPVFIIDLPENILNQGKGE